MRIRLLIVFLFSVSIIQSQAFNGSGDSKIQIGANFQQYGSGIMASFDYGLGENFSVGVLGGYVLGVDDVIDADFTDRINVVARFNANLSSVINIGDEIDIYPGLNLSLKQFGGHLGGRYCFTDGFGVFTEFSIPFARYKTGELSEAQLLHNQFTFSLGAVFNI